MKIQNKFERSKELLYSESAVKAGTVSDESFGRMQKRLLGDHGSQLQRTRMAVKIHKGLLTCAGIQQEHFSSEQK